MFMLSTLIPALAVSVPTAVSEPATDRLVSSFALVTASSAIEAVTGIKDATHTAEEANESIIVDEGDIKAQQMDASKLIPLLVKAMQEQQALIESLTARITALES